MTKRLPLVTIVTPTWNRAEFLPQSLASVRLQTYPNIEHIVIDGGSTDGSQELLERAGAAWDITWISERDNGMYDAINRGFSMASGEIVGWLNSDDWLLPWAIELAVAAGATRRAVFSDILTVNAGDDQAHVQIYPPFSRRHLAAGSTLAQPTVYWPKAAGELAGPLDSERLRYVADCEYWFRLGDVVPFVKLRDFTAVTVDHPGALRMKYGKAVQDELRAVQRAETTSGGWSIYDKVSRRAAWRMEWARFLAGTGWKRSTSSVLTSVEELRRPVYKALRERSPVHRHPLINGCRVNVKPFKELLAAATGELGRVTK